MHNAATNEKAATDSVISGAASLVAIRLIRADGELMIARSVWRVGTTALERKAPPRAGLAIEGATV